MTIVQAPSGASLEYTTNIAQQAEKILFAEPEIEARVLGPRLQLHRRGAEQRHDVRAAQATGASAAGKEQSLDAVLNRVRGQLFGIPGGMVVAFAPPGIQGLSVFGGFQFEVLDQIGRRHQRPGGRDAGAGRHGQPERPRRRALHAVPRRRSAAGGQHRSRSRAQPGTAAARSDRRAAGVSRIAVRQRFRLQQPRLPRLRAGRSALPRRLRAILASCTRARRAATWCRSTRSCR